MDAVMEAVTSIIPSTSAISGTISDMISSALNNTVGRLLYLIVSGFNWLISVAYQLFEAFSGQLKVSYKGESNYLTNIFFENSAISGIYWGMAIIGVVLCLAFTIFAVIRKMFDGSDKMQTSLGAILGSSFKSIILILSLNVAMVAVLNFTNVLMQQVIYVFNAGSSLTDEQEIEFTDDQFATMGRVLNTIGNYSLNPSYNSRYNLNGCFNEIRGDLLHLQQQGVFDFYYLTTDADGEEIETWQSALQTLVFAANLEEELKMDVYNESVSNALLGIMETLRTNTAFYPLERYERTPVPVHNIPFDRVFFLACTYNAALNEQFNINPSHTDVLRGPYYSGQKNIYDFVQVSEDFNLIWGFNYIIFFLIAYGIWKEMWYILLDCIARIYNMVLLYLVGPAFIALKPLDGGGKTKQWMLASVVQCFGIFGTVIAMRLLLTFAPIVISTDLEIFPNAVLDIFAKCTLVYGCAFTARKASAMFTGILADSAGWQSITAGSLRSDWDQYKASSQQRDNQKQQAKQQAQQQKENKRQRDMDTAKSAAKLSTGGGNLKDLKNVGKTINDQKNGPKDKMGLGGAGGGNTAPKTNQPVGGNTKTDGSGPPEKVENGGGIDPGTTANQGDTINQVGGANQGDTINQIGGANQGDMTNQVGTADQGGNNNDDGVFGIPKAPEFNFPVAGQGDQQQVVQPPPQGDQPVVQGAPQGDQPIIQQVNQPIIQAPPQVNIQAPPQVNPQIVPEAQQMDQQGDQGNRNPPPPREEN